MREAPLSSAPPGEEDADRDNHQREQPGAERSGNGHGDRGENDGDDDGRHCAAERIQERQGKTCLTKRRQRRGSPRRRAAPAAPAEAVLVPQEIVAYGN
jgi:hypothetical protein